MAFAVTSLGSASTTVAFSDNTCSIFRIPAANALILVGVLVSDTAGTPVEPSSVSGAGLVFSLITSSVTYNTIASALHNLSIWRGMGNASLVSSVITANFPNNNTGCAMLVAEVTGVDTSGTSGSGAVGKSATTVNDANSAVTVLGPGATDPANAWFALGGASASGSAESCGVQTEKFTLVDLANYATPTTQLMSAWTTLSTGNTVTIAGGGAANNRAGILVELVLAGAAGVSPATPLGRTFRLPTVPSSITGPVGNLLRLWERQLNAEAYISKFSASSPNTSGLTGIPGQLAVNVGSASTSTRLWMLPGSIASIATNTWVPLRIA